MKFDYTFEFYPLEMFKEVLSGEPRHVFICLTEGQCKVEEKHPEFAQLISLFNEKAKQNYEAMQVFFQEKGVLVLFKRHIMDKE